MPSACSRIVWSPRWRPWSRCWWRSPGLATAIPLATFSYGVQHSHYLTVSFIQYLNPLIQFCVTVLLLHDPVRAQGYAAFMVIWVAIVVYSFGAIRAYWERLKRPML